MHQLLGAARELPAICSLQHYICWSRGFLLAGASECRVVSLPLDQRWCAHAAPSTHTTRHSHGSSHPPSPQLHIIDCTNGIFLNGNEFVTVSDITFEETAPRCGAGGLESPAHLVRSKSPGAARHTAWAALSVVYKCTSLAHAPALPCLAGAATTWKRDRGA